MVATSTGIGRVRSSIGRSSSDVSSAVLVGGAVLLLALLPLLPFLVVAWMISRTLWDVREQVSWE